MLIDVVVAATTVTDGSGILSTSTANANRS